MSDCELLPKCVFYNDNMSDMPTTSESMKKQYCTGDNTSCARFMVFKALGREAVPANLFPNNTDKAEEIIKRH